ncbi:MAG: ABC transporter ATP-binding protein [Lachnospiraceae bacterium]|nr:ABC transporter ATP-binding protein [Lachnospiraceae bacterium]
MAKKMEAGQTQTLKKVLHYMKPYRFFLLLSVILAAITVASTLYLPLLIGKAVDCIVGKGNVNFDGLITVLIKMAVMIGITALAQWIMNVCNNKLTYQIVRVPADRVRTGRISVRTKSSCRRCLPITVITAGCLASCICPRVIRTLGG